LTNNSVRLLLRYSTPTTGKTYFVSFSVSTRVKTLANLSSYVCQLLYTRSRRSCVTKAYMLANLSFANEFSCIVLLPVNVINDSTINTRYACGDERVSRKSVFVSVNIILSDKSKIITRGNSVDLISPSITYPTYCRTRPSRRLNVGHSFLKRDDKYMIYDRAKRLDAPGEG